MKLADFDFRIWYEPSKSFVELPMRFDGGGKGRLIPLGDEFQEIELWSGDYDKNCTKIYENDIIRDYRGELFIVSICKETRGWIVREQDFSEYSSLIEILIDGYVEVVGNIHENPDLLGGGWKMKA